MFESWIWNLCSWFSYFIRPFWIHVISSCVSTVKINNYTHSCLNDTIDSCIKHINFVWILWWSESTTWFDPNTIFPFSHLPTMIFMRLENPLYITPTFRMLYYTGRSSYDTDLDIHNYFGLISTWGRQQMKTWSFVQRIHRFPHKGQWRRALVFLWSAPEQTVE